MESSNVGLGASHYIPSPHTLQNVYMTTLLDKCKKDQPIFGVFYWLWSTQFLQLSTMSIMKQNNLSHWSIKSTTKSIVASTMTTCKYSNTSIWIKKTLGFSQKIDIEGYKIKNNWKIMKKKNLKLAICKDLMVTRFHQKNEVKTIFIV